MNNNSLTKLAALSLSAVMLPGGMNAASITMTNNDAGGTSSLTSSGKWSDGAAPSAANDYFSGTNYIRTPPDGNNYTFAGHSLTLQPPDPNQVATPYRSIIFKGTGTPILTINNLTNAGGVINFGSGSGPVPTFTGNAMTVISNSTLQADQGSCMIGYPLYGSADWTNTSGQGRTITYLATSTNSAFKGRFIIINNLTVAFSSTNNVPGNPSVSTPDQIYIGGGCTLLDRAGIVYNNANGGVTLGGNATINTSGTNALGGGVATVLARPITDNFNGYSLTKTGPGILTLANTNDFSGGLNLAVTAAGSQLNLNNPNAIGSGIFTLASSSVAPALLDNTSGSALALATGNSQSWYNSLTFIGSSSLNMGMGSVTLYTNVTVTVSNNNLGLGVVYGDGNGRTFTKEGAGTLTIDGGGYYAGNTIVNAGTLALTNYAYLSSPTITVASNATLNVSGGGGMALAYGQTLTGSGTVVGNVADGNGQTAINPGSNVGTLTINGNLTLNGGGSVNFALSPATTVGGGVNDLIVVSNQLNFAGATTLGVGGTPGVGTYTLFQYGSFVGDLANVTPPPGYVLTNDTSAHTIGLVVTHTPTSLTWQGDDSANVWDLGTTANWLEAGTNQLFYSGDTVTFDNSGSSSPAINLTANVSPAAVIVNSSQNYTFTGSGIITGSLTKSGTGTLVLDNSNSYSGPTVITGGTIQVGDPSGPNGGTVGSLGTGAVTNDGSLVFNFSGDLTSAVNIHGSGSISNLGSYGAVTLSGAISGGSVIMAGGGSLALSGSNSYGGLTVVSSGILFPRNTAALGSGAAGTVVTNGGQIYFDQTLDFPDEPLTLGGSALRKGGGGVTTLGGAVSLVADTTIQLDGGATLNLTNASGIAGAGFNLTLSGDGGSQGNVTNTITLGTGSLTKSGAGVWTVSSTNIYTGKTFINGGTLSSTAGTGFGSVPGVWTPDFVTFNGGYLGLTTNATTTSFVFDDAKRGFTFAGDGGFNIGDGATLTLSNELSGSGNLSKQGAGTLVLSGTNSLVGNLYFDRFADGNNNDGITRITSYGAIQNISEIRSRNTSVGTAGGATLQLAAPGGMTLPQTFGFACRNNFTTPALEVVSGANTLSGNTTISAGGTVVQYQVDAGASLTISGSIQYTDTLTAGRNLYFNGDGNALVSGDILMSANGITPVNIVKAGTGMLTLSSLNNAYSGITTVSNGVLNLTGSITSTGLVSVVAGTLMGIGTINAPVAVAAGGTLAPGASIGTLTVNSDLTLAGTVAVEINKNTGLSDRVTGLNNVTYGGTLMVTNLAGTLAVNDTFTLFSAAAFNGNFTSIAGSPGAGLAYQFNPTNGVLSVVTSTIATNPTNITATVSGSTLTLTWPADHTGWTLQAQTNTLTAGLDTNWVDVPGSAASNTNITTINPANPAVFYRLRY